MCEVWYCVPGMAIDTSSGTGFRQPMVYYCWASLLWCCIPQWISRAKQVHFRGSRLQTCGGNTGHQSMFWLEGHTSNTTCIRIMVVLIAYLCLSSNLNVEADGAAWKHDMGVTHDLDNSSCLTMVCSNHRSKPCGMLITCADQVWACLGSWSFWRRT